MGKKILDFFVKTLNGMAYGLFATLIIGTIIGQIGELLPSSKFSEVVIELSTYLKSLMGVGIGFGVAFSLGLTSLKLICVGVVGGLSYMVCRDPLAIYFSVIITGLFVTLVLKKKTPIDILLIPLLTAIIGFTFIYFLGSPIQSISTGIGTFVKKSTELQPFLMGIIISVVMGMALTAPISSVAITTAIGLDGIAGGAALAGCCCQMVGFAIMSFKDNDFGTFISVLIGTSMLQFKNILKKPIIWLPTIIGSIIVGPIATLLYKANVSAVGAGMGTSGLVGQFQTLAVMGYSFQTFMMIFVLHILIPVVVVLGIYLLFIKLNLIKEGDLKI